MSEWAKENPKHKVLTHPLHKNFKLGGSFWCQAEQKREPGKKNPLSINVTQKDMLKAKKYIYKHTVYLI